MLIVTLLIPMAASFVLVPVLTPIFAPGGQKNYTGRPIPTGMGLAFALAAAGTWLALSLALPVIVLLGFALLGLVDDLLGSRTHRGYRGHFRAWLGGQPTTGGLKAALGGVWAVLVSLQHSQALWDVLQSAGLIVLAANVINLLDVRPGRAGKGFLIAALPLVLLRPQARWLLPLAAGLVGYLPWDLQGQVMMGDTGANPLGAALGYALATTLAGWPRLVALGILFGLNAAAERISFSQLIEGHLLLDWMDKLGRDDWK